MYESMQHANRAHRHGLEPVLDLGRDLPAAAGGGGKLSNKLNGQIKWSNENNCQIRSGRASPREDLPAEEAAAVSCTQNRKTYVYSITCPEYIYIYMHGPVVTRPGHVDPDMTGAC